MEGKGREGTRWQWCGKHKSTLTCTTIALRKNAANPSLTPRRDTVAAKQPSFPRPGVVTKRWRVKSGHVTHYREHPKECELLCDEDVDANLKI